MTQPCLPRDIAIVPASDRVRISFAGEIVADTTNALEVHEPGHPPRIYVPRGDVRAECLAPSGHHTTCPLKGRASYHHLEVGTHSAGNAVWYYPDPCDQVAQLRDHLAFWGDEIGIDRAEA